MPFVVMVAGPNGSGKTTLTSYLRARKVKLGRYINADDIAGTLAGSYDERVRAAQVIADQQRTDYLANRVSFTFETVMSHESKVAFFEDCRAAGYRKRPAYTAGVGFDLTDRFQAACASAWRARIVFQFHGNSSSSRWAGWPAIRARTSASQT
jgi:hypothetical protein